MCKQARLRGLNMGGWLSQIDVIRQNDPDTFTGVEEHVTGFIQEHDFARQQTWGFNHVRLPIDAHHFFDEEQEPVESMLVHLDRAIAWSKKYGLFCVLDLHECPGHDFADAVEQPVQKLFVDPVYLKKTEKIWIALAQRYRECSHVIFEPLNEPVAPDAASWNAVKDALCATIRHYAPNTVIVGSNMWNWPTAYNDLTPVDIDNVIYNFHFYEPLLFTHQRAPWMHEAEVKHDYSYPADYGIGFTRKYGFVHSAGVWNRDRFYEEIAPVAAFGKKYGAAITCNEFGVYAPVPIDLQLRWLDDFLSVLLQLDIGYSYWNYKNLDFGIISRNERMHAGRPQYANPERTNHQVLDILRRY